MKQRAAECARCLRIDHQFKPGRLLHREVPRPFPAEDARHISRHLAVRAPRGWHHHPRAGEVLRRWRRVPPSRYIEFVRIDPDGLHRAWSSVAERQVDRGRNPAISEE